MGVNNTHVMKLYFPNDTSSVISGYGTEGLSTPGTSGSDISNFGFRTVQKDESSETMLAPDGIGWRFHYVGSYENAEASVPKKSIKDRIITALLTPFTFLYDLIWGKKSEPVSNSGGHHVYACNSREEGAEQDAKAEMPKLTSQDRVDGYERNKMSTEPFSVLVKSNVKNESAPLAMDTGGVLHVAAKLNPNIDANEEELRKAALEKIEAKLSAAQAMVKEGKLIKVENNTVRYLGVQFNKEYLAEKSEKELTDKKNRFTDRQDEAAQRRANLLEEKKTKLSAAENKRKVVRERAERLREENKRTLSS